MNFMDQFSSDAYITACVLAVNENLKRASYKIKESTDVVIDDEMLKELTRLGVMQQHSKALFQSIVAELDLLNNLELYVKMPYILTASKYHIVLNSCDALIEKLNDRYTVTFNGDILDINSPTLDDALQYIYVVACEYQFYKNTGYTANTVRVYLTQFSGLFDK